MGAGKLGFTLSADAILTLISAAGTDNSALGDVFGTLILTIFGIVKVTAGLHYIVPL